MNKKDEYGIPLNKPWREVRFYDEYDEHLQPVGEPMNLMDWQAHLQSNLGMARLKIRKLEADKVRLEAESASLQTTYNKVFDDRTQLEAELEELTTKYNHACDRIDKDVRDKQLEADNAALKESAYLADVAFQLLKEHHEFHFGKLVEDLNILQQGYLGRGDAIKILHAWIMDDKNKIGELEQEIKERDQSFDLYHAASMRGIKMWQEATGKDMVWPDQGELTAWLITKLDFVMEWVTGRAMYYLDKDGNEIFDAPLNEAAQLLQELENESN